MTPMMSLFLRCLLAVILLIVLLSLSDYSMAATPAESLRSALDATGRRLVIVARLLRPATPARLGPLRSGAP